MRRASAFPEFMAKWELPHGWQFNLDQALSAQFFEHSYWGSTLSTCVLEWLSHFRWPPADPAAAPEHTQVGVSWMELALSFMFYAHGYIPLHRSSEGPNHTFALKHLRSVILGMNVPHNLLPFLARWSPCVVSACFLSMSIRSHLFLVPPGCGHLCFWLSHRPTFPHQDKVAFVLQEELQKRIRPCTYNWWPHIDLNPDHAACRFTWQVPVMTWNVLRKLLKAGNKKVREARLRRL